MSVAHNGYKRENGEPLLGTKLSLFLEKRGCIFGDQTFFKKKKGGSSFIKKKMGVGYIIHSRRWVCCVGGRYSRLLVGSRKHLSKKTSVDK